MKAVSFRTQARTIDHLGREQIADCPTAISELWKNAYDAYARRVELVVFGDPSPLALVFDDGHGMSREEFESRWLTIGTASKLESGAPTPEHDRNGLPIRPKQGQKGIGRLSIAHLGPLVVVLSKRADEPYVAAVVDWRVFENPYLRLEDVRIPVDTFDRSEELPRVLEALFRYHGENVWPEEDPDEARNARVEDAWRKYDRQSEAEGRSPPSEAIYESVRRWEDIGDEQLDAWPVWTGDASSGTAMIVLDVYPELACWVGEDAHSDDDVNADVRKMLAQSLMGFVDPYAPSSERPEFHYAFVVREGAARSERISWDQGVGRDDIEAIEHAIIGEFDEYGMFRGQIRAFGRAWIPWTYAPPQPLPQTPKGRVGPFSLVIGAFEQEAKNSTHEPEAHAAWIARAEQYAGLFVYRDHLRLLPYGRPNNDFFRIEHRRTKHAGREFWAHRRMFGRVAISRDSNPNLRDKAGREGLIENTALRRFRHLVEDFLRATARRFFGTDAPDRSATIAENKRRFAARAQRAAHQHRRLSREEYVKDLRAKQAPLEQAVERVHAIDTRLERARAAADADAIRAIGEELEAAHSQRAALRLRAPPRELGTHESDVSSRRAPCSNRQA